MIRMALLFIIIILILYAIPAQLAAKTYYIAKNGNDEWSGEFSSPNETHTDGPFATLERARFAVNVQKLKAGFKEQILVQIRSGTYYLDGAFTLGSQDSGRDVSPITYMAYPGETVILSGGQRINPQWQPYKGGIVVASLANIGLKRFNFRQLFVNGERQIRARAPDTGYFHIAGVFQGDKQLTSFQFKNEDIKSWHNYSDAEVIVLHSWDESWLRIKSIEENTKTVTFTGPSSNPFDRWKGNHPDYPGSYFIENVLELLDSSGEWYFDLNDARLYYYPPPGVDVNSAEIIIPHLYQLVQIKGGTSAPDFIRHIRFSNLSFEHTDWGLSSEGYKGGWGDMVRPSAILLEGVDRCAVENCRITNVATYALELGNYARNNLISDNEIAHCGSGGILTYGSNSVNNNTITKNHIHHCGEILFSGIGILLSNKAAENTVSYNHLHDISYCGMTLRGPENVVEHNEAHHVMQKRNDGGGIYVNGADTDGSIIRNNVFHDIFAQLYFGWGIYLDDYTEGVTITHNLVYRTLSGGTMIHGGKYNKWINNIFVSGTQYQIFWNTLSNAASKNTYRRNIFYYTDPSAKLIYVPGTWTFDSIAESDYNLFYCTGGGEYLIQGIPGVTTLEKWQEKGFDRHSIIANPLFADPEHDDYSLRPDSPAFTFDFKPLTGDPRSFDLYQNYPNPFNGITTIKFDLPKAQRVIVKIYNILGQEVRTLIHGELPAGTHEIQWDGSSGDGQNAGSGVYIYRIKTDDFAGTRKMVLLN